MTQSRCHTRDACRLHAGCMQPACSLHTIVCRRLQVAAACMQSTPCDAKKIRREWTCSFCQCHTRDACRLHAGCMQPACSLLHPACSLLQPATPCIRSYAGCMQSACSLLHPACSLLHPACSLLQPATSCIRSYSQRARQSAQPFVDLDVQSVDADVQGVDACMPASTPFKSVWNL